MAVLAVVQDGVVINRIVAEPDDLPPDGCELIEGEGDIGWLWNGSEFIPPEEAPPTE